MRRRAWIHAALSVTAFGVALYCASGVAMSASVYAATGEEVFRTAYLRWQLAAAIGLAFGLALAVSAWKSRRQDSGWRSPSRQRRQRWRASA